MKKILISLMVVLTVVACKDPNEGELFVQPSQFDYDKSMTTILEEEPELYSSWIELLKYADYYNALKDGNANATVFAPTNEAIDEFLASRGLTSVQELELKYAKRLVQNHIINWGDDANSLTDSTLIIIARDESYITAQNLFNKYLNLSFGYKKVEVDDEFRTDEKFSTDSIFFNNQARLGRFVGKVCSNGQIYMMDDVIIPVAENIVEKLEILSGENNTFKIFAEAIKADEEMYKMATLERDTTTGEGGVQIVKNYYFTCFAVPDYVMNAAGITDVESLKTYLLANNPDGDTDGAVALNKYLKYHFMPTQYTIDEIYKHEDISETLIYDTSYEGQAFIANLDSTGKRYINKDIVVLRSDIETNNGLINKVSQVMPVYRPDPVVVKWDFLNSPDIIAFVNAYSTDAKLGNIFTSPLASTARQIDLSDDYREGQWGELTSITYKLNESKANTRNYRRIGFMKEKYKGAKDKETPEHGAYMNNYLVLNLGFAGWVEFTTPTIIAGKYKVVLHYIKDPMLSKFFSAGTLTQFNLDGDDTKSLVYLYKGLQIMPLYGSVEETIWSKVEFTASETHKVKITMRDVLAKSDGSYHQRLDYIEFIPIP